MYIGPDIISNDYINECSICFHSINKNKMQTLPCFHDYHFNCIYKWVTINKSCPLCRSDTNMCDLNIDKIKNKIII
jgi:hypothetical protein